MSLISVRPLAEDEWSLYKRVRLASLTESPDAFAATAEQEVAFPDEEWRERMTRSTRMVAERDSSSVGIVSLGRTQDPDDEAETIAEIFGLWVTPEARGSGVATALVTAAAELAQNQGIRHVVYWVGTDNGRAVAFASGIGFRPTDYRRPMSGGDGQESPSDEEIAMVLPLGEDRSTRIA